MTIYTMVKNQIDQCSGIQCKTIRRIFPIITELLRVIIESHKITFLPIAYAINKKILSAHGRRLFFYDLYVIMA